MQTVRPKRPAPRGKKAAPRKKKRTIFLPALFGITIAFALACLALCWMILNDSSNLMNNKADITLGDYIGMTQDEAAATEQVASGQISVTWEQEYNSDYAAGYIYKQSPVSGRTVREGQGVTLTASLGTQYVTVPDLTNYVQADAEQQLKELGVSVLVTQAVDTTVASGAVIRTDPAAGSQVAAGSTVVVYISRPQVATTTKVPSLTGMSTADARTLLVQNHLGLGSQTDQYSDQPVGTVIGQNPAAGSTAKLNGRVNIVVSAGPEPAPEPEAPSDSTTGGDWWSGLFGSSLLFFQHRDRHRTGHSGQRRPFPETADRLVVLAAELTEAHMKGYITKGIGGFYYVKTPEGIVECKPRGIFRKQKIAPVAGDEVTLETENGVSVIARDCTPKERLCPPPNGKPRSAVSGGQHHPAHPQHAGAG